MDFRLISVNRLINRSTSQNSMNRSEHGRNPLQSSDGMYLGWSESRESRVKRFMNEYSIGKNMRQDLQNGMYTFRINFRAPHLVQHYCYITPFVTNQKPIDAKLIHFILKIYLAIRSWILLQGKKNCVKNDPPRLMGIKARKEDHPKEQGIENSMLGNGNRFLEKEPEKQK